MKGSRKTTTENLRLQEQVKLLEDNIRVLIQWIKTLTETSNSEKDIKYSIKNSMICYRQLSTNKGSDQRGMLSFHLASPFQIIQPPVKSSTTKSASSVTASAGATVSKSDQLLQKQQQKIYDCRNRWSYWKTTYVSWKKLLMSWVKKNSFFRRLMTRNYNKTR